MLHLHPRGQARYPEGGRRREDETPAGGVRVRANTTRRQAPGRRAPRELATRGCRPVPPLVWLRSPRFFTPYRPTRTRQDLPCTSAGDPAPRVSSSRRQIRGERRAVCPQDVPGPPLAANGRHHQQPVNLKLARAPDPRATHRNTLVMRRSEHGRDCSQHCCQVTSQRLTRGDRSGMSAQRAASDGRSWTMRPLLRIRGSCPQRAR